VLFRALPWTRERAGPPEILRNIPVESVNRVSGEDCSLTPWDIIPERQEIRAISSVLAAPAQLSWNLCPKTAVTSNSGGEQTRSLRGRRGVNLAQDGLLQQIPFRLNR
jgi:hypothetical protein